MYTDLPLWLAIVFIISGLAALAWSSDRFVDGAAATARWLGVSPFIIGMVIIGFGTCAPEFIVSVFAGISGHSNLSFGNAYGSCVFNVLGVLGASAIVCPLVVKPSLVRVGGPLMLFAALLSVYLLHDNILTRPEALLLLGVFAVMMPLYCWYDQRGESAAASTSESAPKESISRLGTIFNLVVGLVVMVAASHFLVWGSVDLARTLGVGDLVIGLTIVAIGTSVPELATALASAAKGESELVLGNIVGSNLFNTLCVVGTAGSLSPESVGGISRWVIVRDLPALVLVSITVIVFGFNWRSPKTAGKITRVEGAIWIVAFLAYMALTLYQEVFHG